MNLSQDEILKLAIKHGIIPMRFIVDTYEAKKSSILAFTNAIQSHSSGEAVGEIRVIAGTITVRWNDDAPLKDSDKLYLAIPDQIARIKSLEKDLLEYDRLMDIDDAKIVQLQATNAKLVEQITTLQQRLDLLGD